MLTINTNLSSLIAQSSMKTSTSRLNQAIERMSTGYKINYAKDNAANYSIATNMTTKIGAYNVAEDNTAMGLDLISTAEGTLDQIQDKLQRLRALQEQANNGTYGTESLKAINSEANALVDEINRLYSTAEYNGQKLFGSAEASPAVATFAMTRAVTVDEAKRVSKVSSFTSGETYYLTTAEDLVALQNLVNTGIDTSNIAFEVLEDIDMNGVDFSGIGSNNIYFDCIFNGNGHVIKNLTINTTNKYAGLFAHTKGATITSIGLVDCDIKGNNYVGGIVGYAEGSTIISECYVTGDIEYYADSTYGYQGGIAGEAKNTTTITNCYVKANIKKGSYQGGIVGRAYISPDITNCYFIGEIFNSMGSTIGGIVGDGHYVDIINCYANATLDGHSNIGGILGKGGMGEISNSYFIGEIDATFGTDGGIVGENGNSAGLTGTGNYYNISSCSQASGSNIFSGAEAKTEEEILNICTHESMGFTEANGWTIKDGTPILSWQKEAQPETPTPDPDPVDPIDPPTDGGGAGGGATPPAYAPDTILLQVGASSDWASQVGVSTKFVLTGVDDLRMIGLDTTTDYLGQIDDMLEIVAEKQTHFGAVSNRLESVLEEITIKRDNLISSRSTIRDADIAEVSATYIQQQILQQAAATLLATANQSPSIALQLI